MFGISFAGNLSDQIIFWIWFLGTFFIIFKFIRKRWARIYGMLLIGLTVLSFFPKGVPILTIAAFALTNENTMRVDNDIKVFNNAKSVIARPYISVVKNYWLFEKEVGEIDIDDLEVDGKIYDLNDAKSIIRLENSSKHKVCLEFEFKNEKTTKKCVK